MKKALLITVIAALSTASFLAGLRNAFGHRDGRDREPQDQREAERQRIREALGDIVRPLDLSKWPEHLRPGPDTPDRDTLRNSLPRSARPVWMDLREERDASP